jgi:hypothetical protein
MTDEVVTPQEGMNPEPEVEVEETTTEETEETPAEEDTAEETVPKSQFNQVLARAKKAEAMLKAKPATAPARPLTNGLSAEEVEIKILKAQGTSQEEIDYLKKLAKVNETSIIEAQNDELFKNFKVKRENEIKAQKAKLGVSKGSGAVRKEKSINSPGLSDAEHKELWRSQTQR